MGPLLSLPHLEVLGVIAGLGIASLAAWTANRHLERSRRLERDFDDLRHNIRRLRRELLGMPFSEPAARPAFEPLIDRVETLPGQARAVPFGRQGASLEKPDVEEIATQLGLQSPEAIANLLSGKLTLGDAARQLGVGRQEARLLCWLHGGPETRQPDV